MSKAVSDIVNSWPDWKRGIFGNVYPPRKQTRKETKMLVTEIHQEIKSVIVSDFGPEHGCEVYEVGKKDVTRIEPFNMSGMHADIPYVRVWKGDVIHAEFCKHNIIGVYYDPEIKRTQYEYETPF